MKYKTEIKETLYVHAEKNNHYDPECKDVHKYLQEDCEYLLRASISKNSWEGETLVFEQEAAISIPEGLDITSGLINSLKEQKEILAQAYYQKLDELEGKISDLQAIEYKGGE